MILLLSRSHATSSTWRSSLSSLHSMFTYSWWYFCWAGHLLHHQHEGLHCLHFIPCLRIRNDTFVEQVTCYIINMKVFIVFTSFHVYVFVMILLLSRSLATSSIWRSSLSSLHSMFTYLWWYFCTFVEQVTCYIINMKVFIVFTSFHVYVLVMILLLSRSLATSSTWRSSLSSLHSMFTYSWWYFCWAGHLLHHQHEGLHCLHFIPCLRIRNDTFVEQVTCYIINMKVFIVFTSFHVYVFVMILLLSRSLATSSTWRSSLSSPPSASWLWPWLKKGRRKRGRNMSMMRLSGRPGEPEVYYSGCFFGCMNSYVVLISDVK